MNVFEMRDRLVRDYDAFVRSFVDIADERIKQVVDGALGSGAVALAARAVEPRLRAGGGDRRSRR